MGNSFVHINSVKATYFSNSGVLYIWWILLSLTVNMIYSYRFLIESDWEQQTLDKTKTITLTYLYTYLINSFLNKYYCPFSFLLRLFRCACSSLVCADSHNKSQTENTNRSRVENFIDIFAFSFIRSCMAAERNRDRIPGCRYRSVPLLRLCESSNGKVEHCLGI